MSEGPVIIDLEPDFSKVDAGADKSDKKLNDLVRKEAKVRKQINRQVQGTLSTLRMTVGVARAGFSYLGIALEPVHEALIVAIQTSLTAALAIHRTMEAATVGLSGAATVGLSLFSVGLALKAIAEANMGMEEAKANTDRSVMMMLQLESLITSQQIWS